MGTNEVASTIYVPTELFISNKQARGDQVSISKSVKLFYYFLPGLLMLCYIKLPVGIINS